jgi:hypothetical protein
LYFDATLKQNIEEVDILEKHIFGHRQENYILTMGLILKPA